MFLILGLLSVASPWWIPRAVSKQSTWAYTYSLVSFRRCHDPIHGAAGAVRQPTCYVPNPWPLFDDHYSCLPGLPHRFEAAHMGYVPNPWSLLGDAMVLCLSRLSGRSLTAHMGYVPNPWPLFGGVTMVAFPSCPPASEQRT